MNMKSDATVIFPILSFNISGTSVYSDWTLLGCWWIFFPFEGGYIAAVNSVRIENVINGDRAIIYGTYHLLKHFPWRVSKHFQFPPGLPGPCEISVHEHDVRCNCHISNSLPQTVQYLFLLCLYALGFSVDYFSFEVSNITSVNIFGIVNVLNGYREIIYGTYHFLKYFIWRVAKHFQCHPGLPDPWQLYVRGSFLIFFRHIYKYQIMIFHIMIVKSIADLIKQELLGVYNHYELVALHTIIHDTVIIIWFLQRNYSAMHLSSNQTVLNPGRVTSVLMILVPAL